MEKIQWIIALLNKLFAQRIKLMIFHAQSKLRKVVVKITT